MTRAADTAAVTTAEQDAKGPVRAAPDAGLAALEASAEAAVRRIGRLMPHHGPRAPGARAAGDAGDPELTKNLRVTRHLIEEGVALGERARGAPGIARRIDERIRRSVVCAGADDPDAPPISIETVIADRFALERLLVAVGDEDYLRTRAGELYDEGPGTPVRWGDLFAGPPPLLAPIPPDGGAGAAPDVPRENTRRMLNRLIAAKETQDHVIRARREMKRRVLVRQVLPTVTLATALFGLAVALVLDEVGLTLLCAAAGATGSSLGGLLSLRDDVGGGAQVREFAPLFAGRLVIGAAAGLLAFVVSTSGALSLGGGDAGLAAFSFALGFSEAAFLGLVNRIASAVEGAPGGGHPVAGASSGKGPHVR